VEESVLNANDQSGVVTTGPWVARDGFVAETAVKMDRFQAKIERLEHQTELMKQHMAELIDNAQQANRFQAFEESLRNSREYKIDDVFRSVKDIKARLDHIEGSRTAFTGLTYKSMDVIDKKLMDLSAFQSRLESIERNMTRKTLLFCASMFLLAMTVVVRFA
jgi:phage shock protein A